MTGRASSDSTVLERHERTFVVGLRAETGLYFPTGDTLTVKNFPAEDVGLLDLEFSTLRIPVEGFSHPVRVGLWIDVSGSAPSMSAAIETFGNVARGLAAILSVAANTAIEEPTADVALETTKGASQREYWIRAAPEFELPKGFGRPIISHLPAALIRAYADFPDRDRDRFHRAVVQYHHAIQNWEPGAEIAALTHIWIGMEALTKIVRSQLAENLGLNLHDLRNHYSDLLTAEKGKPVELRGLNDLDAEIRRRHLFQGDDATYKLAKDASNGYEHSFNPLWQVRDQAVQELEPAAAFLRRAIFDYSGIAPDAKEMLLHEYLNLPYEGTVWQSLTGLLTGDPEVFDRMDIYPDIGWSIEPFQREVDDEGDAAVGFGVRIAAQNLPPGLTFQPTAVRLFTAPSMSQDTAILTATSQSALSGQVSPTPWEDATEGGRPISAFQIRDVFDQSIKTDGKRATSFDPESKFRIETLQMTGAGIDREDLLKSAERLRHKREREGWKLLCARPQPDDSGLMLVFQRSTVPMSDELNNSDSTAQTDQAQEYSTELQAESNAAQADAKAAIERGIEHVGNADPTSESEADREPPAL